MENITEHSHNYPGYFTIRTGNPDKVENPVRVQKIFADCFDSSTISNILSIFAFQTYVINRCLQQTFNGCNSG